MKIRKNTLFFEGGGGGVGVGSGVGGVKVDVNGDLKLL